MKRRQLLIGLGAGAFTMPLASFAQQKGKVWRIGFLGAETASSEAGRIDAVRAGLRDLGYIEGKNIVIDFRWAEGKYERLSDLASELARLKIDVLLTIGTKAVAAAKRATATIPIVIPATQDAIATGLVASLARPGGNITGSTFFGPELMAKRLELLRDAMPRIAHVAVLINPANTASEPDIRAMELTAKSMRLGLQPFEVHTINEFDRVFAAMAKRGTDAIVVQSDTMFRVNARRIADLAAKKHLPSAGTPEFAEADGLIGYGVNILAMHRRAAYFVDKILKGARPGDLPIEQATKFEMFINMKTAKGLSLKIPNSILVRADKVIE